jgi:hypothetical protein
VLQALSIWLLLVVVVVAKLYLQFMQGRQVAAQVGLELEQV